MVNVDLTWQQAGVVACGLLAGGVLVRGGGGRFESHPRAGRHLVAVGAFVREAGVIVALYALWQFIGGLSAHSDGAAYRRGRDILAFERDLRLPGEHTVQGLILGHPVAEQLSNLYYATMHFGALIALLVWLFVRHRDQYSRVRTAIVLLTAGCLAVQLVPVAPPRLLQGAGFVDTAARYGQSVYVAFSAVGPDQLSAMPSVHVGWALLVAWAAISVSGSRLRWLVLVHPALTVFVVVATANHYWLDGIVAGGLLVLVVVLQAACRVLWGRLRGRTDAIEVVPARAVGSTRERLTL